MVVETEVTSVEDVVGVGSSCKVVKRSQIACAPLALMPGVFHKKGSLTANVGYAKNSSRARLDNAAIVWKKWTSARDWPCSAILEVWSGSLRRILRMSLVNARC